MILVCASYPVAASWNSGKLTQMLSSRCEHGMQKRKKPTGIRLEKSKQSTAVSVSFRITASFSTLRAIRTGW